MKTRAYVCCLLLTLYSPLSAASEPTAFRSVFDVISAPEIYTAKWANLLKKLHPWCAESSRSGMDLIEHGNVECKPEVQAVAITVSSDSEGRVGMITASFKGVDKCLYMREKLTEHFGTPKTAKGECLRDWRVPTPPDHPQRYVGIESSEKVDEVLFSIGEEQGP